MKRYLLLASLLAACSDPITPDPCSREFACMTPGVDLEVVSVDVLAPTIDAATTLGILQPASIPIRYVIRNRGSVTAEPGEILIGGSDFSFAAPGVELRPRPALEPGEVFRDSFVINATGRFHGEDDRTHLEVSVGAQKDTVWANNRMNSKDFHIAVPILNLTFTHAGPAVAGKPLQVHIVARNMGTHVDAPAEPEMTVCLFHGYRGCTPEYRTTGSGFSLPAVPAGQSRELDIAVTIPPAAAWQDASTQYFMYLCRGRAFTYETKDNPVDCLGFGKLIEVKPDYEAACHPPLLAAGATVVLNAYNCGVRPALEGYTEQTQRFRFHVVAFEAQAGVTYTVQRSDQTAAVWLYDAFGNWVRDLDSAPERVRVESSRRIYLSTYTPTASLSIRVTPEAGQ